MVDALLVGNNFVQALPRENYFTLLGKRLLETLDFWTKGIPIALVYLLLAGLFLGILFHKRLSSFRVPLQITALLWIGVLLFVRRPEAFSRFWFFLLAPIFIFSAAGISGWKHSKPLRILPLLLMTLLLLWQTFSTIPNIPNLWHKKSNDQSAAEYLATQIQPGDMILVGYPHDPPLWYYLDSLGVPKEYWQVQENFDRAYLLVANQSLEKLIQKYHLHPEDFALEEAVQVQKYGHLKIFICPPAEK